MTLRVNQFYHDANYGVVKFIGYSDIGNLIFDRFEKSFVVDGPGSGWLPMGQRVNIDPGFQAKRIEAGRLRPIPPPQ